MLYDLSKGLDREKFKTRSNFLYENKRFVELTEKTGRTMKQNNYLYLILSIFALEYGERVEYIKQNIFKRHVNPDLFVRTKQDKILGEVEIFRSSADLTKEEMVTAIDRFKIFSSKECGIFIPDALSEADQRELMIQIERNRRLL